jgi:hypothetical protein
MCKTFIEGRGQNHDCSKFHHEGFGYFMDELKGICPVITTHHIFINQQRD